MQAFIVSSKEHTFVLRGMCNLHNKITIRILNDCISDSVLQRNDDLRKLSLDYMQNNESTITAA